MSAAKTAFTKCAKTFNAQAKALAEKTKDAHSCERYGKTSWLANIKFLLTKFTEEQVEWIMRSKHARWAADNAEGDYGQIPNNTMALYYKRGQLRPEINREMPGATPAVDAARVAARAMKLARIKELEAEISKIRHELVD